MNVTNALLIKAVREVIRKFIQEKNLKNVVSVINVYPRTPSEKSSENSYMRKYYKYCVTNALPQRYSEKSSEILYSGEKCTSEVNG